MVGHSNGYDIGDRRRGIYFLGTNLVHELRKRGHEVIALDLGNTEREEYMRADVRNYVIGNWKKYLTTGTLISSTI